MLNFLTKLIEYALLAIILPGIAMIVILWSPVWWFFYGIAVWRKDEEFTSWWIRHRVEITELWR